MDSLRKGEFGAVNELPDAEDASNGRFVATTAHVPHWQVCCKGPRQTTVSQVVDLSYSDSRSNSKSKNLSERRSVSSQNKVSKPGVINFEQLRKGMDEATTRARRLLHDETRIYSPTEQFLLKSMSSETGRMTRSRTKLLMKNATPLSRPRKKAESLRRKCRSLNMQLSDDVSDLSLAQVVKMSKNENRSTADSMDEATKQQLGESAYEPVETSRGNDVSIDIFSKSTSPGRCVGDTCPSRKRTRDSAGIDGGGQTVGESMKRSRKLSLGVSAQSCPVPPLDSSVMRLFDDSSSPSETEAQITPLVSVRMPPCRFLSEVCSGPTESKACPEQPASPSEKLGIRKVRTKVLVKYWPSQEVVAGGSGVTTSTDSSNFDVPADEALAHTDSNTQQCELLESLNSFDRSSEEGTSAFSSSCCTGEVDSQPGMDQSLHAVDELSNGSISTDPDSYNGCSASFVVKTKEMDVNNNHMNDSEEIDRNHVDDQVPGPSFCQSLREIHDELYSEVTAMFAPERIEFDVEELANAVIIRDLKTFSKIVERFCSLHKEADLDGAVYSMISKWRDEYGGTLIHLICRNMKCGKTHDGDVIIRALVSWAPELLLVQDLLLKLPLHLAMENGQGCRVTTLLELGSPVSWPDCNNRSPLDIAYMYGNGILLKLLLNAGATFHELIANDEERLKPLKGGHLFKILEKHSGYLGGNMRDVRKKILRNFKEREVLSPVFIAPLRDSVTPTFKFTYNPSTDKHRGGMRSPVLFTYLVVNQPVAGRRGADWSFRCYGPIRCFAPALNGRLLEPMTGTEQLAIQTNELLNDAFVFFCPLKKFVNVLSFKLHEEYLNTRIMLAAQVVMVGTNNPGLCSYRPNVNPTIPSVVNGQL